MSFLEHRQPVPEAIGMVLDPHFRCDAHPDTQESGSDVRHEFLAGIAVIAETRCAEVPIQPVLRLRPVCELMQCGRVIALLVLESFERRKLHPVAGA